MLSFEEFNSFCARSTDFLANAVVDHVHQGLDVDLKSDGTVVTKYDFLIEDRLRSCISENFPDHAIYGEEREPCNPTSPFKWIIDPIDGTFGFSRGVPLFGTLIGFLHNNNPIFGFLRLPLIGDACLSGDNRTALLNGSVLPQLTFSGWKSALALTTDSQTIVKSSVQDAWEKALNYGCITRSWGDCYGYFLLCTGRADIMADTGLKPHDILPLLPILKGSGMVVRQYDCTDYSNIIACLPEVAKDLV